MNTMELLNDEEFARRVTAASGFEEISVLFTQRGVTVTEEMVRDAFSQAEEELDETALDSVAGGRFCIGATIVYLIARAGGSSREDAKAAADKYKQGAHG